MSKKQYILTVVLIIAVSGGAYYWFIFKPDKIKNDFEKYLNSFIVAINQSNCSQIHPINKFAEIDKNAICPREDVGNFMVIDKVSYKVKNILGNNLPLNKQVLIDVCIDARGNAQWNEGVYSECKIDPLLINFNMKNSNWTAEIKDLTNIAELIKKAGEKPSNYQCYLTNCYPRVNNNVEYAIKMHKLPQQGVAH